MKNECGTYLWSFVTYIYVTLNQVMVTVKCSKWWRQLSQASLLAATLYQGRNPNKNHKLWNIVLTERYIPHMQVLLECCYI